MFSKKMKPLIGWCLYGWASDTFPILITTFIFSTYFIEHIALNKIIGTYLWANAATISGIIIAISGPVFGSIADQRGHHKRWLGLFTAITILPIRTLRTSLLR
jgi:MFS transporter, UMF1 family